MVPARTGRIGARFRGLHAEEVTPFGPGDFVQADMPVEGDRVGIGAGDSEVEGGSAARAGEGGPGVDHAAAPAAALSPGKEIDVQVRRIRIDETGHLHVFVDEIEHPVVEGARAWLEAGEFAAEARQPDGVEPRGEGAGVGRAEDVAAWSVVVLENEAEGGVVLGVGGGEAAPAKAGMHASVGAVAAVVSRAQADIVEVVGIGGAKGAQVHGVALGHGIFAMPTERGECQSVVCISGAMKPAGFTADKTGSNSLPSIHIRFPPDTCTDEEKTVYPTASGSTRNTEHETAARFDLSGGSRFRRRAMAQDGAACGVRRSLVAGREASRNGEIRS